MMDNVFTFPSGVTETSATPAAQDATPPLAPPADPKTRKAPSQGAAQAATRLLVEPDDAMGPDGAVGYVYRLVDAVTGRLLAEAPRERAHGLTASLDPAAGELVSTSA